MRGRKRKYFTAVDLWLAAYIRDKIGVKSFNLAEVKTALEEHENARLDEVMASYTDLPLGGCGVDVDAFYMLLGYGPSCWLPDLGPDGWEVVWGKEEEV